VIGEVFFARAVSPIKVGDEILISYLNITWPVSVRKDILFSSHGFICDCDLCQLEEKEETGGQDSIGEKRRRILQEMIQLYEKDDLVGMAYIKKSVSVSCRSLIICSPMCMNFIM
jgi:hypothetical protein